MSNDTIFRRTSLGQAQVVQRSSELPPRMRTLLMLVDGKTSKGRLIQFLPNFGDVESLIEALELSGYITSMPDFLDTNMSPPGLTEEPLRPKWEAPAEAAPAVPPPAPFTRPLPASPAAPSAVSSAAAVAAPQQMPAQMPPQTRPAAAPPPFVSRPAAAPAAMQALAAQQSQEKSTGSIAQAVQYANDTLSEIGSLEAIDLMCRIENCRTPQDLSRMLPDIQELARRSFGPKVADDRMRTLVHMVG
jgi:hypothetical protein